MTIRVKRTYNLSSETVRAVRELAEDYGVAPTQDATVELAVAELRRRVTEKVEAEAWDSAKADRDFQAEVEEIDRVFGGMALDDWPS